MAHRYSRHAEEELERRRLPRDVVDQVVRQPEQVVPASDGLFCHQSRVRLDGGHYLIRVIMTSDTELPVVVTVYKTSRIARHWSEI